MDEPFDKPLPRDARRSSLVENGPIPLLRQDASNLSDSFGPFWLKSALDLSLMTRIHSLRPATPPPITTTTATTLEVNSMRERASQAPPRRNAMVLGLDNTQLRRHSWACSDQPRRTSIPGFDKPIVPKTDTFLVTDEKHPYFSGAELLDFKHVLYNLIAEAHNNPEGDNFVIPVTVEEYGRIKRGFKFNPAHDPDKKLPELYALHIRKAHLEDENPNSVFTMDLYKYYLRACQELMSKYFERKEKYTYLYEDVPLFLEHDTLETAQQRLQGMKARSRKRSNSESLQNGSKSRRASYSHPQAVYSTK